jgi:hypothetical protein
MAVNVHPEVFYSFRRVEQIVSAERPETRTLSRIEALLVSAAEAYRQRRYLDAIEAYEEGRRLIWSQLYPTTTLDEDRIRHLDLVGTLVSYGSEWLNVLPVEEAAAGVRPREVADVHDGALLGLRSGRIDEKATVAAADLETATALEASANTKAASFFRERARSLAGDLVEELSTPAPAPESPPEPAPPAGGGALGGRLEHRVATERAIRLLNVGIRRGITPSLFADGDGATTPVVSIPANLTVDQRSYTIPFEASVKKIEWAAGDAPAVNDVIATLYESRRHLADLAQDVLIHPVRPADVAVGMAHAWYYETPLGLAECYHALGEWATAEKWYLQAAGYQYLNATNEAPYVWGRLANLYLDWGNSLFRDDDPQAALPVYEKVITIDGAEPASDLYTIAGLKPAADDARNVLANLSNPSAITASPTFTSVIFDVWAQLNKIKGGLDFWGHWANNIPIWTFDYLQSVAITFCQLAIGAERDAMSFWEKADAGTLTRTQLVQNASQAKAEQAAATRQAEAADAEAVAFQAGQAAANLRAANAQANAQEYASKSWAWTLHQAQSAQLSGGEDGDAAELSRLADQMMSGPYSISGARGTLSAAEQLTASRIQREYEVDSLKRQAAELKAAATQAADELKAAQARSTAAWASVNAANVRVTNAEELVAAFDQQRFTPDVWNQLGQKMRQISSRYLDMALDVAKRMQRAYNFENDTSLAIIKPDYSSDAVQGLLAADSLLADTQSFTYELVTSTAPKPQLVKQTISLSERYPYLFETQLRSKGRVEFQTTLDDFDGLYPGTYAGRIEYVEVAVDGIVPARGLSGTLTNDGISSYRMPLAAWPPNSNGLKHRVQSRETLVLSDYEPRTDAILGDGDRRRRRIFEGAGVASAWTLELPPAVNELDYLALLDVRLTFTYEARFDPELRDKVLGDLATRPQANERQRPIPLRWLFPDAFFAFYESGVLAFELRAGDFPAGETDPKLTGLSLVAVTTPRTRAQGIKLQVTPPGHGAITVTTGADGTVAEDDLAASAGGSPTASSCSIRSTTSRCCWATRSRPAAEGAA